jgi:hypothetical protein
MTIKQAATDTEIEAVRRLFREYEGLLDSEKK